MNKKCILKHNLAPNKNILEYSPEKFEGHINMKAYKEKCLNNHKGRGPLYYKRYLDDIFCIFERHEDAFKFLDHIT